MDSVKVAVRIRPLIGSETDLGCRRCIEKVDNEPQVTIGKSKQLFTYNYVFDELDGQAKVYDTAVRDLISQLFRGYNVTILAYGQTGSGKTFTMGTNYTPGTSIGVIPRAIVEIFETIGKFSDKDFKVTCSFIELYNENLYDLLTHKPKGDSMVDIREHGNGNCIPGLTEVVVNSNEETLKQLQEGSVGRVTGSTALNSNSSRSHAIFTINLRIMPKDNPDNIVSSKFHFVDLAGSERSKKSCTTGDRFKEGVNINLGLLVLGNVISQLCDGNSSHISYRDSKLTRLLQDSLGGNSVTLMIACVSPADYNHDESLSTLRYADRARKIKNKPIVNQDPRMAELNKLRKENEELRLKLAGTGGGCPPEHAFLQDQLNAREQKVNELTSILYRVLNHNTNLLETTMLRENNTEIIKEKLKGISNSMANKTFEGHLQETISELVEGQEMCNMEDLQSNLNAMDMVENLNDSGQGNMEQNYIMSHTKLTNEIQDISESLLMKEELMKKLAACAIGKQQDDSDGIKKLQAQLLALHTEKEELEKQLKVANGGASSRLAEQRRKRIQELEHKQSALSKQLTDLKRILKIKESSEGKIANLQAEIRDMKHMRVRLIQLLRTENNKFRTWKAQKEREVCQLKNQDLKRKFELQRMERMHSVQQKVLKRKLEEAAAANKQISEALERQKSRLLKKATTPYERIVELICDELYFMDTLINAEKTLQTLIEDRAVLKKEADRLKEALPSNESLAQELKAREEELDLQSIQIADLQERISDSQLEERAKTRWDQLKSVGDYKHAVVYLFDALVDLKKEFANTNQQNTELKDVIEEQSEKITKLLSELDALKQNHKHEIELLDADHQEKVAILLKRVFGGEELSTSERIEGETDVRKSIEQEEHVTGKKMVTSFQDAYQDFVSKASTKHLPDESKENENVCQPMVGITSLDESKLEGADNSSPRLRRTFGSEVNDQSTPTKRSRMEFGSKGQFRKKRTFFEGN